jgi:hypothetical protein
MIYITQYGFWWSTTEKRWNEFLKDVVLRKRGTQIPRTFRLLKNKPNGIELKNYFRILDWEMDDFKNALKNSK